MKKEKKNPTQSMHAVPAVELSDASLEIVVGGVDTLLFGISAYHRDLTGDVSRTADRIRFELTSSRRVFA